MTRWATARVVPTRRGESVDSGIAWDLANRNIDFSVRPFAPGATRSYLLCEDCGAETGVILEDLEKRGTFYMARKTGRCHKCGRMWAAGDIFQETTRTRQIQANKGESGAMEEKRGGCLKKFLIVFLALALIGAVVKSCGSIFDFENRSVGNSYSSGSYTSSPRSTAKPASTPKPSMPSTMQFGDDAEEIVKDIKEALADYKVSWYANGYKLSVTVKIQNLSGDDLGGMYAYEANAQSTIDQLNSSMQSANESTWDKLKLMGYSDCTVVFSMVTCDDMEICTVENGRITHSITKDNFRYG